MSISEELKSRMARIRLLLMDCDGVLTDGSLYFTESGEAIKVFNVRDGQGIANWHRAGFKSGVITGRGGPIVEARARELGIHFVRADSTDKAVDVAAIMKEAGVSAEETAFIGDDIGDLPAMNIVGMPIAVGDAVEKVRQAALFVTTLPGGKGAVREVVDDLLSVIKTSSIDK